MKLATREKLQPYILISPIVALFVALIWVPACYEFMISLFRWDMLDPNKIFIGLGNYLFLFSDDVFIKSIQNTFIYVASVGPLALGIGLGLALILTKIKARELYRMIYFIPVIAPIVVAAAVWKVMYHPDYGILNGVLRLLNLPTSPWLNGVKTALLSIVIFGIWKEIGFYMVIYLAALMSIPKLFYEAARIDGASSWKIFWKITLPLLKPILLFTVVIAMIRSFQVFTPVFVMTARHQFHGGPANSTMVYVLYIYDNAFAYLDMGYASAIAFVGFAILILFTLIQFRVFKTEVLY